MPLSSADTAMMSGIPTTALHTIAGRSRSRHTGFRRDRPLWGVEALTPAELRVALLAADGRSNPEIAATLSVTRGTVESQLQAVYRKLGIERRQELPDLLEPPIANAG